MNPTTSYQLHLMPQVQPVTKVPPINGLEKFKSIIHKLGFTEIALGGISFFFGMSVLFINPSFGEGIWCGSVLTACGIVGVVTRSRPSRRMYIANIAMSIFSACFMILMVLFASSKTVWFCPKESILAVFYTIIAATGLTALMINIVHSVFSCAGICCPQRVCPQRAPAQTSVPLQRAPAQTAVPLRVINGQIVLDSYQFNLAAGFTNLAVDMSPAQVSLQLPLHSNVALPGVQSTDSTSVQSPPCTDEPPSSTNNPIKRVSMF